FRLLSAGSFEFPPPQTGLAAALRALTARLPRLGAAASDAVERACAATPGVRLMGTHHLLVFRREGAVRDRPRRPFGPALLVGSPAGGPPAAMLPS
ncbi:MAG TPA: hypothetical protein VFO60_08530, partial [Candidatus Dormibacteraeota bacterium]|nr:hypothetical protein [Candidatus Dormibacteraeota bacterium]